jgi:hypothetical protein
MAWPIHPDEELIFVYRNDCTISIFENPEAFIPALDFAPTLPLTVG